MMRKEDDFVGFVDGGGNVEGIVLGGEGGIGVGCWGKGVCGASLVAMMDEGCGRGVEGCC